MKSQDLACFVRFPNLAEIREGVLPIWPVWYSHPGERSFLALKRVIGVDWIPADAIIVRDRQRLCLGKLLKILTSATIELLVSSIREAFFWQKDCWNG